MSDLCVRKEYSIETRSDAARLLLDLIRPLKPFYSPGHAWLKIGETAAHYGEMPARMEGYARVLWGLGPLWSQSNKGLSRELQEEADQWLFWYRDGMIHGTDPSHEEYWGDIVDYDQKMVEMAALVTAIALSPDKLWEPLKDEEKENLYRWLNQINGKKVHANNWRFFRILVNMVFTMLGLPASAEKMEDDRRIIEGCYTGDGWYFDGHAGQVDYYIPFAMHFYGLIYARFMEQTDPDYAAILKKRSDAFSRDYVYWFENDGNEAAYGRSLTYRFAHSAFFGAMGFAGVEGVGYGVMKHLALKNLENWVRRPIFDNSGVLTIGYGYPNLFMSERYNAPGSPYWAFKAFILLAMDDNHPFWQAKEEPFPYEALKRLPHSYMLAAHPGNNHVLLYPTGQHRKNMGACSEKYEKFVYSNQFGFSVSRGFSLVEGAFDNTLAVSLAEDDHYRMRCGFDSFEVTDTAVVTSYRMMPGVEVTSHIIPCGSWHVRIHEITTACDLDLADGGFAVPVESMKYSKTCVRREEHGITVAMPGGVSKVVSLDGGIGQVIDAAPNTNLLYNLTIIPTILKRVKAGSHVMITCVMGDCSERAEEISTFVPCVAVENGMYCVEYEGKQIKGRLKL